MNDFRIGWARWFWVIGFCALAAHAHAAPPAKDEANRIAVQLAWDQQIPMRDGVALSAAVFRDPKQSQKLPVIFAMTPYVGTKYVGPGVYFAQRGYVVVVADSRGRGNSQGSFVPTRVEANDGYDAIEWIAKQPWCNGQVAMWGGSWLGFTQWTIAKLRPPHLRAIAPTASVYPGVDFPFSRGMTTTYVLRWLAYVHGRALNEGLFESEAFWSNADAELARGHAFRDYEAITGIRGTVFQTWLAHPTEDAYWRAVTPSDEDYAKLEIPVLTITGVFDADQLGALTYYERHRARATPASFARHALVIGPWDHAGTRRPKPELGGETFGDASVVDILALHVAWYDHVLKGAPAPAFLRDRVMAFFTGRNQWVSAASLEELEGAGLRFALDATGAVVGDVLRGGALTTRPAKQAAAVTLVSDPTGKPREPDEADERWMFAQRESYEKRTSHVEWHSEPLDAETALAGRPRLVVDLAIDQPDSDVSATLSEIRADGTSVYLTSADLRLRYRRVNAALMRPGAVEEVAFPPMQWFARTLAKGSRLRLSISAEARPGTGIQLNTNTGGDLATEPSSKARVAHLRIQTGPNSHSRLEIPRPSAGVLRQLATP